MFVYNYANNADHTLNREGLGMKSLSRSGMLLQTHTNKPIIIYIICMGQYKIIFSLWGK